MGAGVGASTEVSTLSSLGRKYCVRFRSIGAFVSADSGETWKTCGQPTASTVWYGLAFDTAGLKAMTTGGYRYGLVSFDGWVSLVGKGPGLQISRMNRQYCPVSSHPCGRSFRRSRRESLSLDRPGPALVAVADEGRGRSWPSPLFILPEAPDRFFAFFPGGACYPTALSRKPERRPSRAFDRGFQVSRWSICNRPNSERGMNL